MKNVAKQAQQSILFIRGVDAHETDEQILKYLRERRHQVSVAVDGKDAVIKALNRTSSTFDVIISNGVNHSWVALREVQDALEAVKRLPEVRVVIAHKPEDVAWAMAREFTAVRVTKLINGLKKLNL